MKLNFAMNAKRLAPLFIAGLLVTTGLVGLMSVSGTDHWDPEPEKDPVTGRFVLDTLDEFSARGTHGDWSVLDPERAAQRSGAFQPSFFITDRGYVNTEFHTTIETPINTNNDNGFVGLALSFKDTGVDDEHDTLIIDWNSKNLTRGGEQANEGLTLFHIDGAVDSSSNVELRDCFFLKNESACPANLDVLDTYAVDDLDREGGYRNTTEDRGWVPGGELYDIRVKVFGEHPQASHTNGLIVSVRGGPAEDWNPYNGSTFRDVLSASFDAEPEGFGFYTFNQGGSAGGAAQFLNPSYDDKIEPKLFYDVICPDGEGGFGGWCGAPVALQLDVVDDGSGVAFVECTIDGEVLEDCDRDHGEPGVFDLDLSAFQKRGPTGSWSATADGSEATQLNAGERLSLYVSDSGALPRGGEYLDVDYLGEIGAPPTGANNNIIGWAFGHTLPAGGGTLVDTYVIDWKAAEQEHLGHTAAEGLTFYRITGQVANTDAETFACYWGKDPAACDAATGGNAELEVLATHTGAGTGWEHDADYTFRLEHYEDRVALTLQGGTNYATETTVIEVDDPGAFPELGQFGAFNFRQEDVTYRNLAFEEFGQQIGVHGAELLVKGFDHAGNKVERTIDLKIDLEAPVVDAEANCQGDLVGGWCNGDVETGVSASALSGIQSTTCDLDGTPGCEHTVDEDGIYTFTAAATSFVGHTASDVTTFQRDATAPEGALLNPVPGCSYVDNEETICLGVSTVLGDVTFNVTAADPVANGVSSGMDRVEFYDGDEKFAEVPADGSGWFNASWSPSGIGPQSVEVHLIDQAGNVEILEYSPLVLG